MKGRVIVVEVILRNHEVGRGTIDFLPAAIRSTHGFTSCPYLGRISTSCGRQVGDVIVTSDYIVESAALLTEDSVVLVGAKEVARVRMQLILF